ncbi:MAG TPA: MFS transporter [Solirubrobacteraceae bacterium]|nr:MFS transporter [Solirubrobacteraceae bacterium]
MAVLALPTLLVTMDMSVLFLAVPKLTRALHPSSAELLWITYIYGFFIAGSLLTMGALGDRIGHRRLLLTGGAAFAVGSLAAAFSTSPAMLIAARALLGIAGASLAPSSLALITSMFTDERQRATAIGIWISCFAAGAAIGPLVGGALLEHFWWGSVFLPNVAAMALLLAIGPRTLPSSCDATWHAPGPCERAARDRCRARERLRDHARRGTRFRGRTGRFDRGRCRARRDLRRAAGPPERAAGRPQPVLATAHTGFVHGFRVASLVAAGLALGMAAIGTVLRDPEPHQT